MVSQLFKVPGFKKKMDYRGNHFETLKISTP